MEKIGLFLELLTTIYKLYNVVHIIERNRAGFDADNKHDSLESFKKLQKLEEKVFFRSFLTKSLKSFIDVMKMWAVKYKR